jgi:putative hemolysin
MSKQLQPNNNPLSFGHPILERLLGVKTLANRYEEIQRENNNYDSQGFIRRVLNDFGISYDVSAEQLQELKNVGPVIVVANHPFGGIEGLLLLEILRSVRPDTKFLANYLLGSVPELNDCFVLVDPFENQSSTRRNITPLRSALTWLKQGGVLGVFPSGTVSHLHLRKREVLDPPWSQKIAALARRANAAVLPIYIHGRNSTLFQIAGLIHPLLRTALLPREFYGRRNCKIRIEVGNIIPTSKINEFTQDEQLISYLRLRTFLLKNRTITGNKRRKKNFNFKKFFVNKIVPIEHEIDKEILAKEISKLPSKLALLESGNYRVYCAKAWQIPNTLLEIGRLREITYREAGEGTGKGRDLDTFDRYYTHLFTWNTKELELVGAYRMAKTDAVLRRVGVKGLYTRTLFDYNEDFLKHLGDSIELGRSFVRPEYQKSYSALLLLWKGIGKYIDRYPKYKNLIGPVSINDDYDSVSRQLLMNYLKANSYLPNLAKMVKAKNSPKPVQLRGLDDEISLQVIKNINEVSLLIGELESGERVFPVLLKQYLKLGGRILGFNIDPDFSDVLDALILVDLTATDKKILERYFGEDGVRNLTVYHAKKTTNLPI